MRRIKDIDYSALDYSIFRIPLRELESAAGVADNLKAAELQTKIAKLGDQIAKLEVQKANLQKQVDAIEKK